MMREDSLGQALKALADHDRDRQAATSAAELFARAQGAKLVSLESPRRRSYRWLAVAGAGLAAAAMLALILQAPPTRVETPVAIGTNFDQGTPAQDGTPVDSGVNLEQEADPAQNASTVARAQSPDTKPIPATREAQLIPASAGPDIERPSIGAELEPVEVVTDFFPLRESPLPFERGQLLRVVVPAYTMRSVGLPVRPERWSDGVQADVLVGEEGLARAIRFVSYEAR